MIKFFDRIAERVAFIIAQILVKARIKPLYVTIFRFVVAAPISWYFFSRGEYLYSVIGLLVYIALAFLDWADGDMAQLYKLPKQTAPLGRLFDHTSDRALMMIVLAAIFYGGMTSSGNSAWITLTVAYYSIFFFLTVSLYEFDSVFGLEFARYPELEREMHKINRSPSLTDKLVYNLLNVHNNSITRLCFTHNFVLLFGILANQLLIALSFLALMHTVRAVGIFWITYETFKVSTTHSALAKVLRNIRNSKRRIENC